MDEARVQRITVVAGFLSVLAVISGFFFGFFGAGVSPVSDARVGFFDSTFLYFYALLAVILVLVVVLFWLVRRRYPLREVDSY